MWLLVLVIVIDVVFFILFCHQKATLHKEMKQYFK